MNVVIKQNRLYLKGEQQENLNKRYIQLSLKYKQFQILHIEI